MLMIHQTELRYLAIMLNVSSASKMFNFVCGLYYHLYHIMVQFGHFAKDAERLLCQAMLGILECIPQAVLLLGLNC